MAEANRTTNHDEIRNWVEERDGRPARVEGTDDLLRIDFPDNDNDEDLEEISWEEFFDAFEENDLAFLYQDDEDSRFNKIVAR